MSTYSVADAKAGLPRLIDKAMAGEEVIITRHGKPTVELRPTAMPRPAAPAGSHDWFLSRRVKLDGDAPASVELLTLIYGQPNG
jgi:prevent-host-death family protein